MKFQSVIDGIMHAMAGPARVAVIVLAIPLSSCVSLMATKHTYAASASSPSVKVNGAQVRLQLKPEGTSGGSYVMSAMVVSAAVTTLDGPFRWRIEAIGQENRHESMVIHRLRTHTKITKRDEWYPTRYLGKRVDFIKPAGSQNPWRAVFDIPGTLQVKPREDGALEILADLSVRADGRTERRIVKFRLDPSKSRQDEFIFVPTEIVKSIGKPMSEWEETGWD
jgi:hypothetical protein